MSAKPLKIGGRSNAISPSPSPLPSIHSRQASIVRLSSPVPSSLRSENPYLQDAVDDDNVTLTTGSPLAAAGNQSSLPRPGPSALSSALAGSGSPVQIPPPSPPRLPLIGNSAGLGGHDRLPRSNYGSFDQRDMGKSPMPVEDPEIIKRHLVQHETGVGRFGSPLRASLAENVGNGLDEDEFSSLRLQGGDMTRNVYKWAEDNQSARVKAQRSKSFHINRPEPESEVLDINTIRVPGGFRRDYLRRQAGSPAPSDRRQPTKGDAEQGAMAKPPLFTNNFLEFLTLYGHFAGENLEEDDEVLEPDEYFSSDPWDEDDDQGREPGEGSALLTPATPGSLRRRRLKERSSGKTGTPLNAALLLLKSFVGTGVLFLPRAFYSGGMLFSSLLLIFVAILSFYCFILLITTRQTVGEGSFGDLGGTLYGKWMRTAIQISIILSQVGFVSAYTVFTAENLQAFVLAVSKCKTNIHVGFLIMLQLVIFLPLSLIRDISKLGFTALVADAFILLGLIYLYYYDVRTIVHQGGIADITLFNSSNWTLFIGTAIFTFEGVGLIIPIQESMRQPEKFPRVLAIVTVVITILFTSIGALSYAAYGSKTKTVVLLNLPQDDKMVNAVQFLYSLAILLSTPLQLFPAIRIMENELFTRSGKYNPYIKWKKNVFRFFLVCVCALIAWGGAGDLDKLVALVGSFACVPLVYVYPPLLHLKAVAKNNWQRVGDYAVFVFGLVGCVYTTVLTVQQWAQGSVKSPGYCDSQDL